jgi:hypothetical protein
MDAIRKIVTVRDNVLKVVLPDSYNDKNVELIILPADETGLSQAEASPSVVHEEKINYEEKIDYFTKFYGKMKSNLSEEELDKKLKSLRDEWNRDIS